MATLRNKRKLAAVTRETQEEHPRNGQSRNTSVPRINEEYIKQVSQEIEGRVTKKLSQEFSRTESRILVALSKLDEFLLNPQLRTHSGTVPGTFRNTNVENQGTNEDDSQSDPHPEAGIFRRQTTQNSGPKDCRDKLFINYFGLYAPLPYSDSTMRACFTILFGLVLVSAHLERRMVNLARHTFSHKPDSNFCDLVWNNFCTAFEVFLTNLLIKIAIKRYHKVLSTLKFLNFATRLTGTVIIACDDLEYNEWGVTPEVNSADWATVKCPTGNKVHIPKNYFQWGTLSLSHPHTLPNFNSDWFSNKQQKDFRQIFVNIWKNNWIIMLKIIQYKENYMESFKKIVRRKEKEPQVVYR